MPRSRSRRRSRSGSGSGSRSRSSSSSSYDSSSSEDSDEKEQRLAREEERKAARLERKEAAKRKAKEAAKAAERKANEAAATDLAGKISWMIMDTINEYEKGEEEDDEDDEDSANMVQLLGRKKSGSQASVVDCNDWAQLEAYLRKTFDVDPSNKKVGMKVRLSIGGVTKLAQRIVDADTMANWWAQMEDVLDLNSLPERSTCSVYADLFAPKGAFKKKKTKKKGETARAKAERDLFNSLVKSIYGEKPGHFAEGQWTAEASEIMRRNGSLLDKFLPMQRLTEKVMGDSNYMPNPCVIVCPFGGAKCPRGRFRMNGSCKPSQLYSHWQTAHSENPAAKQLEARWRKAIKDKSLSTAQLDACVPVEMEPDEEAGGEPLRAAPSPAEGAKYHWPHTFARDSAEHDTWLQAVGDI
jgi:hypothetical protein